MGTYEIGGRKWTFRYHWQISRQNWINLKSINIRSIIIIKQIQNMNLMLNMKDINKILAKTHFKCKKKRWKNPHFCENMSPCHAFTSTSCYLREKSSLPIFCKCGEPWGTSSNRHSLHEAHKLELAILDANKTIPYISTCTFKTTLKGLLSFTTFPQTQTWTHRI